MSAGARERSGPISLRRAPRVCAAWWLGRRDRMLDPRIRVLTVSGELDLQTQRRLRSDLSEAAGDRSRELLIDLRGVTFLDSSVLAVLVTPTSSFGARDVPWRA